MDESPQPSRRWFQAVVFTVLALASLFGGAMLTGPGPSSDSRLTFVGLGFIGYLLFGRFAIRAWRPDVDQLWRDDGPNLRAALIAPILFTGQGFRS